MEQIPVDLITAEPSVLAGVAAMERIHGRHLADMTPQEQAQAREHWRAQVEQVLLAVRDSHAAEGVEDAASLDALRVLGCDLAQGFHLGRPMPAAELTALLRAAAG